MPRAAGDARRSKRDSTCLMSVDFDVAGFDYLGPRGDVLGDRTREPLGRGVRGLRATGAQPLLHLGLLEDARDRLIKPRDDFPGRARRRPHAGPAIDRVAWNQL